MKSLWVLPILLLSVFAIGTKPIKLEITQVDEKNHTITLKKSDEILVGESGIVIHDIGATIISNTIYVTKIDTDSIQADYVPFTLLEQKYLPTPVVKPKVGDSVVLRSFYSRGFIVAPNQQVYEQIKNLYSNIHFVNSDLMIADVGDQGIVNASKKAFQQVCKTYSVGLLAVYNSSGLHLLDCQSFQILQTQALSNPSPEAKQYPFFARVEAKSFWDFLKRKKDYYAIYDALIK
ncbi:hypothetical protein BBW65_07275 [Helicobacter enhydrae]|uniref:Plasminogen-binding protein PgbA N-terminal domain-containing protein n=1 Tax=Helicobacter enhydrae TaxID=222136 RepID=A0A1B1U762_9HELI|nr:plasminogen-binding N-terminal domain-containing protein [Helicobacter enhydrae]ANV98608.1 hypothetical protein BBW65_07275 [Helicobacter enhydrae]